MKYFQVQPGPRPAIQTAGQTRAGGGAAARTPAPPEHRHHPEAGQDPGRSGEYDEIFPEIHLATNPGTLHHMWYGEQQENSKVSVTSLLINHPCEKTLQDGCCEI